MSDEKTTFRERLTTIRDNAKRSTIRSKLFKALLVLLAGVIAFMSYIPYGLSTEVFTNPVLRNEFIVRVVIAVGLALIGLIAFETIGSDSLKNKPNGLYQNSLNGQFDQNGSLIKEGYVQIREKVKPYENYFYDWKTKFDETSLYEAKLKVLTNTSMEDPKMVLKHIEDIENPYLLCDHIEVTKKSFFSRPVETFVKGEPLVFPNGDVIVTKKQSQVKAILDVQAGKVKIRPYEAPYYLSIDNIVINKSQVDRADALMRAKKENQAFSRTYKTITVIIFATFWAMLTTKDYKDLDLFDATFLLISRLGTLAGGLITGWMEADRDVRFDTDMVKDRTAMLKIFYNDIISKKYIPTTYEEKVRKEKEEYELNSKDSPDRDREEQTERIYSGSLCPGDTRCSEQDGLVGNENQAISVETNRTAL